MSRTIARGDITKVLPLSRLNQDYKDIATFSGYMKNDVFLHDRVFLKKRTFFGPGIDILVNIRYGDRT
jgi:hypothetical protein